MLSEPDCSEMEKLPDLIIQMAAFSTGNLNTLKKRVVELKFKPSDYLIQLDVKKIKKICDFLYF